MNQLSSILSSFRGLALVATFLAFAALPQWIFLKGTLEGSDPYKSAVSSGHNMKEMGLKLYKEGALTWVLDSDKARSYDDGEWQLDKVSGKYSSAQKNEIIFSSDKGKTDLSEKSFSLLDNVKAKSAMDYRLETESLHFETNEEKEKIFKTADKVQIYNLGEELEVHTTGLRGKVETGEVTLLSEVSCKKSVKDYKDILIKSDKAYFKSSLRSIRFKEHLRVSQENFKIKGEEAYFVYDELNRTLKSVQIDGDILASDGLKTAMSDRVEMRTTEDVIIFQGSPRIKMGKNEMVGEEILITNKQKNIQVIRGNIKSTKQGAEIDE